MNQFFLSLLWRRSATVSLVVICGLSLAFVNLALSAMVIRDAPAPPVLSYTMVLKTKEPAGAWDTSLRQRAANPFLEMRLTAFARRFGSDHQPVENFCPLMKNADDEFNARKAPLLAALSAEGLQIARANHWPAVVIEMSGVVVAAAGWRGNAHCYAKNPQDTSAIDEPSARLLDAAQTSQQNARELATATKTMLVSRP